MDIKRKTQTRERVSLSLTGSDIINLLKEAGEIDTSSEDRIFTVSFKVPTGGDWSGMDVDIDKSNTVNIDFEVITNE